MATRDRAPLLAGLLDALQLALRPCDDVLVVDSASRDDETARTCEARGVRLIRLTQPGTSRARNAGWRACGASLVAFTDDDCRPQPGWTAALSEALQDSDFVTGRVIADRVVAAPVSLLDDDRGRELTERDPVGHGANCAFRRDLLERLDGFDERLGPGTALRAGEDADLFVRALHMGNTGRYEPAAVVVHQQWRGRGRALGASFSYGVGQGGAALRRRSGLRRAVWTDGLGAAGRDLRAGYVTGAAAGALRGAGALVGAVTARLRR